MNDSVLTKLHKLHVQACEVFDSDLPWETKYDLIFSKRISRRVFSLINLDYYDPDSSYEDDVRAFMDAFNETMINK